MATAMVFGTALRAAGDSRSPLYIGVLTNLVNLALNWVLIYGNLGFPALGVAGAAMASSLSMFLQIGLFLWLWYRGRFMLRFGSGGFRPDFDLMRQSCPVSVDEA